MRAVQEVLDQMDLGLIDGGHPECPQIHIPPAHTHATKYGRAVRHEMRVKASVVVMRFGGGSSVESEADQF